MRYIFERLKQTTFGKKYLTDGALISFLKRVKHLLERVRNKIRSKLPIKEHYDKLLSLFEEYLTQEPEKAVLDGGTVDVIVPIYNGYEYLLRLFEDLPKTALSCRYILVDDKSPDARVQELEQAFVKQHPGSVLLQNSQNLGFVKSVNRGLAESRNHVALINTDTELPNGWLERLMQPIFAEEKVASATPYTNSATIFSFPDFCYNNPIYLERDVETLDSYFRKVRPRYAPAPTGVGFCMGMNRAALDEIGVLDEETFGRGFGEENDWCQRAIKKGYRNVQVENLFVYHKHGGSFQSEEKKRLIEEHMELLTKRFPNYNYQVSNFIRRDPNQKVRQLMELLIDTHEKHSILYFDHSLGGGATSYLNTKKQTHLQEGSCVSVVRYSWKQNNYQFFFENDRGQQVYEFDALRDLFAIGDWLHFDEIYINELVTYPRLWEAQECIVSFAKEQDASLIMLFHDFFALCPTINLMNDYQQYCGMPPEEECETCYLKKGFGGQYECKTRKEWLAHWKKFLSACSEVRTFSEDTRKRVEQAFGDGLKLTMISHQVDYVFPIEKDSKTSDTINVGLLGVLAIHKGSDFIKALLKELEARDSRIRIKLIGRVEDGVNMGSSAYFEATGGYQLGELPRLIYENDVDLFLLSSVWPETFSYTAEEVIKMGMPIAAFDLGAPAERIRRYEKGLILQRRDPAFIVDALERFAVERLQMSKQRVHYKKIAYVVEYVSFSSRYRIEHMQEELLYLGVPGELWETASLPKEIDWSEIGALVIYRCRLRAPLDRLIGEAKKHGVPLFYDIDDYIFDYDAIRELPFLRGREYRDFETYSALIRRCMEECDALLVSTEHLKQAAQQTFADKPVFVNRNRASAEMLMLSALALNQNIRKKERLVLGYFSGSNTHGRDFEIISQVLLEFMKENPQVYLKIVGCLALPPSFDSVKERVLEVGFLDWHELPAVIASVDVNLMPLEESFFHACKSENKWMEAALVKVPTIGSYNQEVANATAPGENILLCQNEEEWRSGLQRLLDAAFRQRLGQRAYEDALAQKITLKKNWALLEFIMEESSERTRKADHR